VGGVGPEPADREQRAGFFAEVFDAFPISDRSMLDAAVAAKLTAVLAP
jgi:hypothetical protein